MIIPNEAVKWYRDNYDDSGLNDYDVYEQLKSRFGDQFGEENLPTNPYSPSEGAPTIFGGSIIDRSDQTNKQPSDINTSPSALTQEGEGFVGHENMISMHLAELFADKGGLGLDANFWKKTYNESLAGMAYLAMNGRNKYDVDDEYSDNQSYLASLGQFVAGMGSLTDVALFFGMGGIGQQVAKGAAKGAWNKLIKHGLTNRIAAKTGIESMHPAGYRMISQGIGSAGGLGGYGTAVGFLQGYTDQKVELLKKNPDADFKDVNYFGVTKDAVMSGVEHTIMGAVVGATGGGIGYGFGSKMSKLSGKNKKLKKGLLNIGNYATQVGVEAGEFTAMTRFVHGGEEGQDKGWMHDYMHNVGVIGLLKATHIHDAIFKSNAEIQKNFEAAIKSLDIERGRPVGETLGNLKKVLEDSKETDVSRAALEEINKIRTESIDKGREHVAFLQLIIDSSSKSKAHHNKKIVDPKYKASVDEAVEKFKNGEKLNKKEQELLDAETMWGANTFTNYLMQRAYYERLIEDAEFRKSVGMDYEGDKLNSALVSWEKAVREIDNNLNIMGKAGGGNVDFGKMQEGWKIDIVKDEASNKYIVELKDRHGNSVEKFKSTSLAEAEGERAKLESQIKRQAERIEEGQYLSPSEKKLSTTEKLDLIKNRRANEQKTLSDLEVEEKNTRNRQKKLKDVLDVEGKEDMPTPRDKAGRRIELEELSDNALVERARRELKLSDAELRDYGWKPESERIFISENKRAPLNLGEGRGRLIDAIERIGEGPSKDIIGIGRKLLEQDSKYESKTDTKRRVDEINHYMDKVRRMNISDDNKAIILGVVNDRWGNQGDMKLKPTKKEPYKADRYLNAIEKYAQFLESKGETLSSSLEVHKSMTSEYIKNMTLNQKHAHFDAMRKLYDGIHNLLPSKQNLGNIWAKRGDVFNVAPKGAGERTTYVPNLRKVFPKISQWFSKKGKDIQIGKDVIEKDTSSLLVNILREASLRPEDIKNSTIVGNKLRWYEEKKTGKKGEMSKQWREIEISNKLLNQLKKYAKSKGINLEEQGFLKTKNGKNLEAKHVNKAVEDVFRQARDGGVKGADIKILTRAGESPKDISFLDALAKDRGALQAGRIFRQIEQKELKGGAKKHAKKLGDTEQTAKQSYIIPKGKSDAKTIETINKDIIKFSKQLKNKNLSKDKRLELENKIKEANDALGKFQLKPTGKASSEKALIEMVDRLSGKFPGLKEWVKLNKDNKDYAGRVHQKMLELVVGKANEQTVFHELGHLMEEFITKTKDKTSIKLWKRGEKVVSDWAKKHDKSNFDSYIDKYKTESKAMNEYFTDKIADWANNRYLKKGLISRIGQWARLFTANLKKLLFGNEKLNKKDIQALLGEKLYKGFDLAPLEKFGVQSKFQYDNVPPKEMSKILNKKVDLLLKGLAKVDKSFTRRDLIDVVAEWAGIKDPSKFYLTENALSENLAKFAETLADVKMSNIDVAKLEKKKNLKKWLRAWDRVESLRIKGNITDAKQEMLIKDFFGKKNGRINELNLEELQKYLSILNESGISQTKYKTWVDRALAENKLDKTTFKKMEVLKEAFKELTFPVFMEFESLGYKGLSRRMLDHTAKEVEMGVGKLASVERYSQKLLGGLIFGKARWNKIKEFLFLLDDDSRIWHIKEGKLTSEQNKFLKSVLIDVNARGKENVKSYTKKDGKYYGQDGKIIKGDTGKYLEIIKAHEGFNKFIRNNVDEVLRIRMNSAEFERFQKQSNIKWLQRGFYIHRPLSKEFMKYYNPDGRQIEKIVKDKRNMKAEELARQELGENAKESAIKKKATELLTEAEEIVWTEMYDMFNFSPTRVGASSLNPRQMYLGHEVYSSELGRNIKVYDTSYEGTFGRYAVTMGKFIANVEFFPEYVNLKGFDMYKSLTKGELSRLQTQGEKGKHSAQYIDTAIKRRVGANMEEGGLIIDGASSILNIYADLIAKTQLGFPTAGIKNALVGNVSTISAYGPMPWIRAFAMTFHLDSKMRELNRQRVIKAGGTQMGYRAIESPLKGSEKAVAKVAAKIGDVLFAFGGMQPTEDVNRYISFWASKIEQRRLVKEIQTYDKGSKTYEKAYKRLNRFYKLGNEDIQLLEKHGWFPQENRDLSIAQRTKLKRRMETLYQRMNTISHTFTQGATVDTFMPNWASKKLAKPLTLYKRMAYAATYNTTLQYRSAAETGNFHRILLSLFGHWVAGDRLMAMQDFFLGTEAPFQNEGFAKQTIATMQRGEMLGIASELINPHFWSGDHSITFAMQPAINSHLTNVLSNLHDVGKGRKKMFGEGKGLFTDRDSAANDILRNTSSFYNAATKYFDRKRNKYNGKFVKFRQLSSEFNKNRFPELSKGDMEFMRSKRTPYYNLVKNSFNLGTKEEFARMWANSFLALATDFYRSGRKADGDYIYSWTDAFKEALKQLDSKMTSLNPNKYPMYTAKGRSKKDVSLRKAEAWDRYLTEEQRAELKELETQYHFKKRSYEKFLKEYLKKNNMSDMIKDAMKKESK